MYNDIDGFISLLKKNTMIRSDCLFLQGIELVNVEISSYILLREQCVVI